MSAAASTEAVAGAVELLMQLPVWGASIPQAPVSALFLSAMLYSFAGWLWESFVCSLVSGGSFTNRGFLLGPVCPIYGAGALVIWLTMRGFENPVALFFMAGLTCCCIEWVVSLALEAITGARFWHYENLPLNIQGRVCLYGFLLFGAAAVVICRVVEPAVLTALSMLPGWAVSAAGHVAAALLVADFVFAMASWRRLSTQLESLRTQMAMRLNEQMGEASDRMIEAIPDPVVERGREVVERGRGASIAMTEKSADAASAIAERGREAASAVAERGKAATAAVVEKGKEATSAVVGKGKDAAASMAERGRDASSSVAERGKGAMESAAERGRGAADRGKDAASEWLNSASEKLVSSLGKRDLRFFVAFPHMRMERYDNLINRTHLRERVADRFRRK